jgi:hypothetical protein
MLEAGVDDFLAVGSSVARVNTNDDGSLLAPVAGALEPTAAAAGQALLGA